MSWYVEPRPEYVLVVLHHLCGVDATIHELVWVTGASEPTVRRCLRKLRDLGVPILHYRNGCEVMWRCMAELSKRDTAIVAGASALPKKWAKLAIDPILRS